MTNVGLATIGQAPRDDVVPSMFPGVEPATLLQAGALDDLDDLQISDLAPTNGQHPLVTRLSDGREVVISKELVTPLLANAVDRLASQGAQVVCVLCTGEFALDTDAVRLVYPDRLLVSVVDSLLPEGRLGVLIPHEGQREWMREKWRRPGRSVEVAVLSPYGDTRVGGAVQPFIRSQIDMVVLDCMGFSLDHQKQVEQAAGVPAVLANRLVGAVIDSIVSQPSSR